jgi:hypothetical protein
MSATEPEVVGQAAALAEQLHTTSRRSAFEEAARDFRRLIRTVPDHAADEITVAHIAALTRSAERAIDGIENRLYSMDDPPEMQLELARTVYSIRHSLERIDRWHRHYAGA